MWTPRLPDQRLGRNCRHAASQKPASATKFATWTSPATRSSATPAISCLPMSAGPGQQKLKAARVLIVGAGGLGAPVIQYLAAAGVGTLGIVDDEAVALSNLQRQVIHPTATVGARKVESAAGGGGADQPPCQGRGASGQARRRQTPAPSSAPMTSRSTAPTISRPATSSPTMLLRAAAADHRRRRPVRRSITTLKPYLVGADGLPNPT